MTGGPNHIPALDGLRGLAAAIVVVSHYVGINSLWTMNGSGVSQIGVMLFFILSGFLMGHLYLPKSVSRLSVAVFAKRRIARVVPLFFFVVLLSFAVTITTDDRKLWLYAVTASNVLHHIAFVSGTSVLWTIPVEVQFYLAFPVLWALHAALGVALWRFICTCIAVLLWALSQVIFHALGTHSALGVTGAYFISGVVASTIAPGRRGAMWVAVMLIVASLPQVRTAIGQIPSNLAPGQIGTWMWRDPSYLVVCTLFVWAAASRAPLLERPIPRSAGALSYSLYLWHMPVFLYFHRWTDMSESPLIYAPVAIGAAIGVSLVSYFAVENPIRRWINSPPRPSSLVSSAPAE